MVREDPGPSQVILEALPVAIWATDAAGQLIYQNPAARCMLDLALGTSLRSVAPKGCEWSTRRPLAPADWPWQQVLADPTEPRELVASLETGRGNVAGVIFSAAPIRGGAHLEHLVLVGVDCSSLVAAQEKLRHHISLGTATLDAVTNGVLVIDRNGRIAIWNRVFVDMWRIPLEALETGDDLRALDVALERVKDPARFLAKVQELYARPTDSSVDLIELTDGRLLERVSIPQLLDGVPIGRVWSFADVTDQKRHEAAREAALAAARKAQAEAEAARERLRVLADASQALANALVDPDAVEVAARVAVPSIADWCIIDELAEPNAFRRLAVAHADPGAAALARRVRATTPHRWNPVGPARVIETGGPELYAEVHDQLLQVVAENAEHLALLRALGVRSALVVPLAARGRVFGTVTLLQSTSGRRFSAADLPFATELATRMGLALDNARLYARLEDAVKAREELLSVVSHDLRNPVTAILAAAQLGMRAIDAAGAPPPRKHLQLVTEAAKRLNERIERLLDLARLDAAIEGAPMAMAPLDPERLVREVVELEQPLAVLKHIVLESEVTAPLGPISGSHDRLRRVLENLIGNAIKFTPEGGHVVVRARIEDRSVRFEVADSGPGIREEELPHVFDRYWQATSVSSLGVGLGLAIAKRIVEAHGGCIDARNLPGGGAVFSFYIPRERSPLRGAA